MDEFTTRAAQLLFQHLDQEEKLEEEIDRKVGQPKPADKAGNAFKHQYAYKPGAKTPSHLKMRQNKTKTGKKLSKAVYSKPWVGDSPKDLPKRLMSFKSGTEKSAKVTS